MKLRRQYKSLDLAKFGCSLLVVVIHASPFAASGTLWNLYVRDVLARCAVPLFFVISGFLFFDGLIWEGGKIKNCRENTGQLFRYTKRLGLLYIGWSVIYILVSLPRWYVSGWWGVHIIKDCVVSFLFEGFYYHLWFLLSLLYAVPGAYLLMVIAKRRVVTGVITLLWMCELLVYSYSWVGTDQLKWVDWIHQRIPIVFDAGFRALPLFCVGALCRDRYIRERLIGVRIKTLAALLLVVAEATALYWCTPNTDQLSYLVSTPVFAYYAMTALLTYECAAISETIQKRIRGMSLTIYCIHPMIILVCSCLDIPEGFWLWLSVTVLSVVIAFVANWCERIFQLFGACKQR